MRIPRIYFPGNIPLNKNITLDNDASHHIYKVLRLKPEHLITLFNGQGGEYLATIEKMGKNMQVFVTKHINIERESPLKIHLVQGMARFDRMDIIIQKSVELGVSKITPIFSKNSIVKLDEKRGQKKQTHWQKLIISACMQCGRNTIPDISPPIQISELLSKKFIEPTIVFYPTASNSISNVKLNTNCTLLIGPESGFTENEINIALNNNAIGCQLGPRILRTETAAISAINSCQVLFGDLK